MSTCPKWTSLSLTFGRQSGYHTITGRLQMPTRAPRQINRDAGVFPPNGARMDGERARQLANTLLSAKDEGHHRQERASALTSLRRTIRGGALGATISWFTS